MNNAEELKLIQTLIDENKKLRMAGSRLAIRALYTVSNYDGLHRLSNAIAQWNLTISNEFGRDKNENRS